MFTTIKESFAASWYHIEAVFQGGIALLVVNLEKKTGNQALIVQAV